MSKTNKGLTVHERLVKIQQELKSPKGQKNEFGNYNYRSCEDILEAVKPLLGDCKLTIGDRVVKIGDRYYVKAQAKISNGEGGEIFTYAYAREPETKKGMDESQITGASSSYARKYALNGLFAIDDTKDADTMDNRLKKPLLQTTASKDIAKNVVCPIHKVKMIHFEKDGREWWSHKTVKGEWCNGRNTKYNRAK